MAKNSYIVGIDVGTRKVVAIIGEITEEKKIEIIGIGTADSHGLRKGVVVNLEATTAAIKKAQDAGVMVIALDSPLQPKDASDALFATNNFVAGELIGKYAAAAAKAH